MGAEDIDLLVHRYNIGCSSPCVVITNRSTRSVIGGSIDSLEQIFDLEVARHPGYVVKERVNLVAMTNPKLGDETATGIPARDET
jgi:hypothetical protein